MRNDAVEIIDVPGWQEVAWDQDKVPPHELVIAVAREVYLASRPTFLGRLLGTPHTLPLSAEHALLSEWCIARTAAVGVVSRRRCNFFAEQITRRSSLRITWRDEEGREVGIMEIVRRAFAHCPVWQK